MIASNSISTYLSSTGSNSLPRLTQGSASSQPVATMLALPVAPSGPMPPLLPPAPSRPMPALPPAPTRTQGTFGQDTPLQQEVDQKKKQIAKKLEIRRNAQAAARRRQLDTQARQQQDEAARLSQEHIARQQEAAARQQETNQDDEFGVAVAANEKGKRRRLSNERGQLMAVEFQAAPNAPEAAVAQQPDALVLSNDRAVWNPPTDGEAIDAL